MKLLQRWTKDKTHFRETVHSFVAFELTPNKALQKKQWVKYFPPTDEAKALATISAPCCPQQQQQQHHIHHPSVCITKKHSPNQFLLGQHMNNLLELVVIDVGFGGVGGTMHSKKPSAL